jgi:hypothetical protein
VKPIGDAARRSCRAVMGAVALLLCLAPAARGQQRDVQPGLVVEYGDAGVTIIARSVPLRVIVREWARLGDVRVVNPQHVALSPVTIELRDMPEGAALKVLLAGLPGYLLQRRPLASAGRSAFDRLVVMGPPASLASTAPASDLSPARAGGRVTPGAPPDGGAGDDAVDLMSPPPGAAPPADGAADERPSVQPRRDPAPRPAAEGQARPGAIPVANPPKNPGADPR